MKLQGKVAIITGAASGIGKATAELFISEGAKAVIADISPRGAHIAAELGDHAFFIQTDVRKEVDIKHMIQETIKKYTKIDILMNHAGIGRDIMIDEMTELEWDDILDTNLKGMFLGIKHAVPQMKKQNHGVIINTGSELSFVGDQAWTAYSASKGGVLQLTKSAAIELVRYNIRVNALCPGPSATPLLLDGILPEELQRIEQAIPMGRLGTPEEAAKGALFLASDDSSFMTGAALLMDGGIVAKE
jgi:NAD(P)-dependent dehydrogenase (short-subunit alcohol dehydrogenase family)